MDEKLKAQDLAEILGVSRQYIYTSGRLHWGVPEIEEYAQKLIDDAAVQSKGIKSRLKDYLSSMNIDDIATYTITEADKVRFFSKVEKQANGCWVWTASHMTTGYGQFRFRHRQLGAHRFSYWLHSGEFPNNSYVCHKCDNKSCVNPDHLFLGNQQDNMNDLVLKRKNGQRK